MTTAIGILALVAGANLLAVGCLGGLLADDATTRRAAELARLTAPLPPARDITGELPRRVPTVRPEWGTGTLDPPPDPVVQRVAAGLRRLTGTTGPGGRHRLGVALGSCAQRYRWNANTLWEFETIVAPLTRDWCDSCRGVVAHGERTHEACPGCACPCSTVVIGRPPAVAA